MLRTIASTILIALPTTVVNAGTYSADVWADNWFEMRVNGETIAEDSVPITTERSFNAESFTFEAQRPFTIGLIAKDFKENDTGLEYIGSRRQQMGDGGVILQIKDSVGNIVAVSNSQWNCLVTHSAPLNKSCASEGNPVAGEGACAFQTTDTPEGWDSANFEAADWPQANLYTQHEVRPKDGYDKIRWSPQAKFMWGPDLEQSNTVLCRLIVE